MPQISRQLSKKGPSQTCQSGIPTEKEGHLTGALNQQRRLVRLYSALTAKSRLSYVNAQPTHAG